MSSPDPAVAAAAKAKGRIIAFDAFRGIAILFVVFGHTTALAWPLLNNPERQFDFWLAMVERNVLLPCLPIFLFLSGYLLGSIRFDSWADYGNYLSKRVSRVAIPFLFWSVFFLGLSWAFSVSYTPLDALLRIVTGRADGGYYFILLIIQFYLLTPVFIRILDWRYGIHTLFAIHMLVIFCLYLVQFFYWPNMPYEVAKTPFIGWLSLFPMGIHLRRNPQIVEGFSLRILIPLAVLFGWLSIMESVWLVPKGTFELAISDLRYMPLAYGYTVILILLKLVHLPWPQWLATLGGISFGIFFIHGFVLRRATGLIAAALPTLTENLFLFQSAITLLTLAICISGILIARRILPEWITSRVLAF